MKSIKFISLLCVCMPIASSWAQISDPVRLIVEPDAALQWRTLMDSVTPIYFDWPEDAQSANWTVCRMGRVVVDSGLLVRGSGQKSASFAVSVSEPTSAEDEASYLLSVTFKDANGTELAANALSATVARVRGVSGCCARYLDSSFNRWRKIGKSAVLPIAMGADPVVIDGQIVDTGLNGAVGWYGWSPISSGSHVLSATGLDPVSVQRSGGLVLYIH